jgi:hypothetical protein
MLKLLSNILEEIKYGQKVDLELVDRLVLINQGNEKDFRLDEIRFIGFRDRFCVSDVPGLRGRFYMKVIRVVFVFILGTMKMYLKVRKTQEGGLNCVLKKFFVSPKLNTLVRS